MIDASTAHLSKQDRSNLEVLADVAHEGLPRVADHETGWVVFTYPVEGYEKHARDFGFSSGFVGLLRQAVQQGAMLINFDAMGLEIDGLPTYEW